MTRTERNSLFFLIGLFPLLFDNRYQPVKNPLSYFSPPPSSRSVPGSALTSAVNPAAAPVRGIGIRSSTVRRGAVASHQPRVLRMSRAHNQLVAQMRASFRGSLNPVASQISDSSSKTPSNNQSATTPPPGNKKETRGTKFYSFTRLPNICIITVVF